MTTRDALIEAATALLDEGGVDRVTLREVGRLAGVSHNAPYKHFADKEALLAAVAARELAKLAQVLTEVRAREHSDRSALHQVMRQYIDWALAHPTRFALVFGEWKTESPELTAQAESAWDLIVNAVAAAQQSGGLPAGDPERIAALIRATAYGAVALTLAGHLAPDGKGHADAYDLVDEIFAQLQP